MESTAATGITAPGDPSSRKRKWTKRVSRDGRAPVWFDGVNKTYHYPEERGAELRQFQAFQRHGGLLGALTQRLPEVFEAEVLPKLDLNAIRRLLLVNKECRDAVCKLPPVQFLRTCLATPIDEIDMTIIVIEYSYPGASSVDESPYGIPVREGREKLAGIIIAHHKAAAAGRVDVLKWLLESGAGHAIRGHAKLAQTAARHGRKDVIKWLLEIMSIEFKPDFESKFPWYAKVLRETNMRIPDYAVDICADAALYGHFEVLKFLRANGLEWDEMTCDGAAESGNLEMLKWAHAKGCPLTDDCFCGAAAGGNLETLQWLREKGCVFDEGTMVYAAEDGRLEALKWLHDNGCVCDEDSMRAAADSEHWDCVEFLIEINCPGWKKHLRRYDEKDSKGLE